MDINPLHAIPPRKSIFVSCLINDTTTADIEMYAKRNIGNDIDISTQKFKITEPPLPLLKLPFLSKALKFL